jgi:hypothetical protein
MHIPPPIEVLVPSMEVMPDGRVVCQLEDLRNLVRMALTSTYVDESWYRKEYRDVAAAITNGSVLSAAEHYRRSGYLDGRVPFPPVVDAVWYLEQNIDIQQLHVRPAQHFIDSGYHEGRIPHKPAIDDHWYLEQYPDAKKRVEDGTFSSCEQHFLELGYKLGYFPTKPLLP